MYGLRFLKFIFGVSVILIRHSTHSYWTNKLSIISIITCNRNIQNVYKHISHKAIYLYIYVKAHNTKSTHEYQAIVQTLFRSFWISIHINKMSWNLERRKKTHCILLMKITIYQCIQYFYEDRSHSVKLSYTQRKKKNRLISNMHIQGLTCISLCFSINESHYFWSGTHT